MSTLPTVNSLEQLIPTLKIWQQTINPVVNTPVPPRTPFNLNANGGATGAIGNTLSWEVVKGADGYQVQASSNGDFTNAAIVATLTSPAATSWFDNTVTTGIKRYYRVRATTGTNNRPQSVPGTWTAAINSTSGSGNITYDQTSNTSGNTGWNNRSNPGIGGRNRSTL